MRNCRNKSGGTGQHQTLIEAGPVPARLKNTSFPGFNFVYFLVIFITDSVLLLNAKLFLSSFRQAIENVPLVGDGAEVRVLVQIQWNRILK